MIDPLPPFNPHYETPSAFLGLDVAPPLLLSLWLEQGGEAQSLVAAAGSSDKEAAGEKKMSTPKGDGLQPHPAKIQLPGDAIGFRGSRRLSRFHGLSFSEFVDYTVPAFDSRPICACGLLMSETHILVFVSEGVRWRSTRGVPLIIA
ncbi:hypothetical protein EUGRSUZ_I01050 [Eucalyptus grandis]|uniref:Uncharacterized protein n=2 Tax=Eucalyptus grandis TaxID=71139 RepID=A0ACC3JDX6_EUCGR|nr:hypothetical protein EUGRSUZ_I01050 [Eucalyptus grandis]